METKQPVYYVVRTDSGGGHSRGNPDAHNFWVEHPDGFQLHGLTHKAAVKLCDHLNNFINSEMTLENEIRRLEEIEFQYQQNQK